MDEKKLTKLYLFSPAGLSSADRLLAEAKKEGMKVKLDDVQRFLQSSKVYSDFLKKYKKAKKQRRVIASGPFQTHFADLCFFKKTYGYVGLLVM